MDLRRLLLVFLVIAVVLASSFFLLGYDETVKYTRVGLTNTSSIEMPISDQSTNSVINNGIYVINDTKHDLTLMYFNSEQGNQIAAVELEYIRNEFAANAVQETLGNQTVWHNEENGTYMAFIGNHITHDNILIICKDPEMLEHMIASARYVYFNEETNTTETINGENASAAQNASSSGVDSTKSASNQSSSSNVPAGYYWSGQDADYIREYDDANGVHHIDRLHGPNEAIDTVNNKHYTNGVEDTEAYNKDFN
ncbi:MAG: hypothetical protein IJI80_02505 [Methanobrevibacter sp.]|uniref:hypothetical protein n=1 Tax=Methanobrevibacter sp. TaxID=66852 RepID=UPI0025F597CA|nr:hypothetical protein [Methanobrevibacter sp.]MBQ6138531.1 hypothetical protein [Methanobrevibacter sp.]